MNNVNYCPHCGEKNETQNQGKFCTYCGKEFNSIVKNENTKSINDTNIHVHVESSEKARAKSGAMALLAYPMIFAVIIFCPLMPIAYIIHDVLRYTKWNWIREEGFSWKKKIRFYVLFCIIFYSILIYISTIQYKNGDTAYFFFGFASAIFYIFYWLEDSGNPEKVKENEIKI